MTSRAHLTLAVPPPSEWKLDVPVPAVGVARWFRISQRGGECVRIETHPWAADPTDCASPPDTSPEWRAVTDVYIPAPFPTYAYAWTWLLGFMFADHLTVELHRREGRQ